jgi:pectinesterase
MKTAIFLGLLTMVDCSPSVSLEQNEPVTIFPKDKSINVNPDTHLVLTFSQPPKIGTSGLIRIIDSTDNKIIDTLDLKIPASPSPSGKGPVPRQADPNDKNPYQINTIAGVDFHFFPIIVRNNTATITLHNGALKYGKRYVIKIDPEVLVSSSSTFEGFTTDTAWTFSTKASPPPKDVSRIVVSADGTGDFNTVQGAIDLLPGNLGKRVTILIKNGQYEEIVYMSSKTNVTIRGESRTGVKVGYPNNSAFNPPKSNSAPSRRVAFSVVKSNGIQLSTFTIQNYFTGQAEALLVDGEKVIIDHMTLNGSGDAFTTYGTIYFVDSTLTGDGDTVLGYGAVYFLRSTIKSIGPFTWTRTPAGSHGNVFVNSTLIGEERTYPWMTTASGGKDSTKKSGAVFARLPRNNGPSGITNFPNAEMVLINVKTSGVSAEGWGSIEASPGFDSSGVKFWEFNTMDLEGKPVDVSKRHPASRQLTKEKDAKVIEDYSRPEFVLKGWTPVLDSASALPE